MHVYLVHTQVCTYYIRRYVSIYLLHTHLYNYLLYMHVYLVHTKVCTCYIRRHVRIYLLHTHLYQSWDGEDANGKKRTHSIVREHIL